MTRRSTSPLWLSACVSFALSANTVNVDYQKQALDQQSAELNAQELFGAKVDTFALWHYIRQQRTDLAMQELQRLKQTYPTWRPEKAILDAIAAQLRIALRLQSQAQESEQQPKASARPTVVVDPVEQLFSRLSRQSKPQWQKLPNKTVSTASKAAFAQNNPERLRLVGWILLSRSQYRQALEHFQHALAITGPNTSAEDGRDTALKGMINEAIKRNDQAALTQLIAQAPTLANAVINASAWQRFDAQQFDTALTLFTTSGHQYGQVLTLEKMGQEPQAFELACQHVTQANLLHYCIEGYAKRQLAHFQQQEYHQSEIMAEAIQSLGKLNDQQMEIYAWTQAKLNHRGQRQWAFAQLISRQPNNHTFAKALVDSFDPQDPLLDQFSHSYPSVQHALTEKQKQTAWSRKQFNRFYALDSTSQQADQTTLSAGFDWQNNDTGNNLTGLQSQQYSLGYTRRNDGAQYGLKTAYLTYQGGNFDTQASQLQAFYRRQGGDWNALARLTYQQPQDNLPSRWFAMLSGVWFDDPWSYAASLYRDPIEETILSTTGVNDEGERWGSVSANGARALFNYQWDPTWSSNAQLDWAWIEGTDVGSNQKFSISTGLNKDIASQLSYPFDYLRLGPYLSWMHYQENQNDYSLGNGGYFSPQQFISAGGQLQWLSEENRTWQWAGRIALGYNQVDNGDVISDRYGASTSVSQSNDSGLGAALRLEGQWLLDSRWELAGLLEYQASASYDQALLGIELRWNQAERTGVTSDGLISSSPYRLHYAWY
ncbi:MULTISPECIES: cellulose synthase subunit BcsC-related outer membrane protein [unclassified Vibrio]|uniref:Cellulose synthase subunit BcsC-related outer membrane protein n=1 Tax=Vibrio sp. HB236076 TaxID=3232307 RepID=A0AB39HBM7_9VIBR|nr:cellulose synthase subunit BcsC-related outer membrane protein [Vibrio sp. HB161653]MDP5255365.1 cellulose synthase subunit BcsC-related outer membrane protein [Vibrio sp. HB161653]